VSTAVVLVVSLVVFDASGVRWPLLIGAVLLSGAAFSALGALISVSVVEVFEEQTLANAFRFPMMFLGGVFMSAASLPPWLRVVARGLALTYAVEAMRAAMGRRAASRAVLDLLFLAVFAAVFFVLASRTLARRVA
jgi:ABC-type multidrug transport system permease subunit